MLGGKVEKHCLPIIPFPCRMLKLHIPVRFLEKAVFIVAGCKLETCELLIEPDAFLRKRN